MPQWPSSDKAETWSTIVGGIEANGEYKTEYNSATDVNNTMYLQGISKVNVHII